MTIDRQALDKLREIVGGEEADLIELVYSFLEEAPGIVGTLTRSLETSDVSAMRRAAHSLKSNARDMGARELADLCAAIEARCAGGELAGTPDIEAARSAFAAAAAELRDMFPAETYHG